jgi:hypothetical protein
MILNTSTYLSKKHLLENTFLSDSIIYINYLSVLDILKKDKTNNKSLVDSLSLLDETLKFENFSSNLFSSNRERFNKIAFFSKPYKNTLLVEVVDCLPCNLQYSKATRFTASTIYIIFFKRNYKIANFKKIEMLYD